MPAAVLERRSLAVLRCTRRKDLCLLVLKVIEPGLRSGALVKEAGELYLNDFEVTLVFRRDRYGRGGDHIPFNERGYAAVRSTEPNENIDRQHKKVETVDGVEFGDVVDRVDFA